VIGTTEGPSAEVANKLSEELANDLFPKPKLVKYTFSPA
jgi:hypothetical protein